jgi:hypothetical protein
MREMPSQYRVVHYVPNPLTDERYNVGLVIWEGENCILKLTDNWRRFRAIAGPNYAHLRKAVKELEEITEPQASFEVDRLRRLKLSDVENYAERGRDIFSSALLGGQC